MLASDKHSSLLGPFLETYLKGTPIKKYDPANGGSTVVDHWAHNSEVEGSNPVAGKMVLHNLHRQILDEPKYACQWQTL